MKQRFGKVDKPWTESEIEHVAKRWNVDGANSYVIAAETGRSRSSVCGMIKRNRDRFHARPVGPKPAARSAVVPIVKRPSSWAPGERDEAARLWADGMLIDAMAKRLGKTVALVKHLIRSDRKMFPKRYTQDGTGRRIAAKTSKAIATPQPVASPSRHMRDPIPHAPDGELVGLAKRRETQCACPLWDSFGPLPTAESPYCGAPIGIGEKYCAFHRRLMYRSPEARAA